MDNGRALRGWLRLDVLMRLCCCLALLGVTQGQFFSKTTNTIPRMGRRAFDYPPLEEQRLGRVLGLLRADPSRQSVAMADLGYLLRADGVQYGAWERPTNAGCHGNQCRVRGAALLPTLQAIDNV
ncbi:uncharacterized protein LOC119455229 [Dermacentor silvarum]|uniref:uncharacterized protein LOC119455229 n=1 Tax=Dermacentor silvarum TaxID=543639 RepID=UPI002100EEC7|nr:uncharacterized protein LOC119455229 [Dermacentor silvarum]